MPNTSFDVVVIGGGFAGLAAAVDLTTRGARVLVLEAKPSLGGRATAFRDPETGELVDNGQHILLGCYTDTFRFLSRIGSDEWVWRQGALELSFVDRNGHWSTLRCPTGPVPLNLVAGVLDWDGIPLRDRLSILKMIRPLRRARRLMSGSDGELAASPGETISNWLIRNGQTPTLREMLWTPLALAALNQSPDKAGATAFVRVLAEMFARDSGNAAIVLPARPLLQFYTEPAKQFVEQGGGQVRTGAVAQVEIRAGALAGVTVAGERIPCSRVIAAVPWFALESVFGESTSALGPAASVARRLVSQPIVTVNLWFDRPVMDAAFVGLPGRTMQWVFDKRAVFGGEASHLSLVSSGAEEVVGLDNHQLVSLALNEVHGALPGASQAILRRSLVVRERRATFALAPGTPALPDNRTDVAGVVLAGDWVGTPLPSTIEAAVRSGHQAAAIVAESLKPRA